MEGVVLMFWFVLGFVGVVLLNSVLLVFEMLCVVIVVFISFLLIVVFVVMGLEIDLCCLWVKGVWLLLLGVLVLGFILVVGFGLVLLMLGC